MRRLLWSGLLVCVLIPGRLPEGAVASAPLPSGIAHGVRLPCGVADSGGRTGYVANANGGIDALDLVTGDLLWTTRNARRPLLLLGDKLCALGSVQPARFRVVLLEVTQKGRPVLTSEWVTFPEWVHLGGGPGASFVEDWRVERGELVLTWEARAWYVGKVVRPAPAVEAAARKHASGVVRVDLETGQVRLLPSEPAAVDARPGRQIEKKSV